MEEAHPAAAAGSIAQRRRPPHLPVPVPETDTDRRRRRPSPSEPDFEFDTLLPPQPAQLPDIEFEVILVEAAPPPAKRACIPASSKAIQGLLKEVTAASGGGGDDECAICLQDLFNVQEEKLRAMPCSHTFHQHCIFEWLRRKTVCPLCRHQLMMPITPTEEEEQQEEERMTARRRASSAYHFDDDEDYIASLGDAVIIQEIEVDVEDNMERIRVARAVVDRLMRERGWRS